jgi:hypothetical protein
LLNLFVVVVVIIIIIVLFFLLRTKWKRQTAVGLELLAEAGNYAAFQRLYGAPPYGCWYPPQTAGPTAAPSAADIYYRQAAAAAAATLQKPLPYRLYPPGMGLGMPGPSAHLGFVGGEQLAQHLVQLLLEPDGGGAVAAQSESRHPTRPRIARVRGQEDAVGGRGHHPRLRAAATGTLIL